jgi:ABC-type phosphate/phosphonate transport system ATPase subunit
MNSHFRNEIEADSPRGVPAITVRNVAKTFGSFIAMEEMSFEIMACRFVSLIGPSGCGKSTLLNMYQLKIAEFTRGKLLSRWYLCVEAGAGSSKTGSRQAIRLP